MSIPSTIQAVHPSSRPVWGHTATVLEKPKVVTRKASRFGWQWLLSPVYLLLGLLVQLPSFAQTFCAPDATAYYTFERTFQDQSTYVDIPFPTGAENITSTFSLPTFSTTAKVGASSASFNGSQYLRYDDATTGYMINGGNSVSVMFWFKANAPGTGIQTLFEQGDATNGIGIRLNAGTGALQARVRSNANGGGLVDLAGPNITDTGWHHVAFTLRIATPSVLTLYLDGTQVSSGTLSPIILGNVATPGGIGASLIGDVWGASATSANYFNGYIDDFVYSLGPDVNAVGGIGPSIFTQTDITNYLTCVNGFAANSFTCDGAVYIAQQPLGTLNTALKQFIYASNSFATIDATGTMLYNAAGYNQVDSKIYAISSSTGALLRIGANGVIEDLGFVASLPPLGYNTGDISSTGIMYISSASQGIIYAINLNVKPYTATAVTITAPVYVGDWSINPADNLLYSVDLSGRIEKINPATGALTVLSPANGFLPAGVYGAIWFDQFNNMYAYENLTGAIQRYNLISNSWSTVIASGASISNNDAAACPSTRAEPQIAKVIQNQSGNTVTFDITLSNNGPSPAADLIARDALPTGLIFQSAQVLDASNVSLPATNYSLITPAVGANGTVQLTVKNLNVGPDNRVILRLTVKATSGNCNLTATNCAEIISAFGQTTSNGTLGNTADNTTNIPGDMASNNEACAPVSFSLTPSAPTATISNTVVCSGGLVNVAYTNIPAGQTVSWVRMPDSVTGTGSLSQVLSATGTVPVSYTYIATVSNIYGCPSPSTETVVTVNPVPVITPSTCSQTICSGQTGAITFVSSIPSATINWLRVEDGLTGTGNISSLFASAGNFTYKIWGVSAAPASCPSSTTITCTILVNQCTTPCNLTVTAAASQTAVCVGQAINFTSTVSGNAGPVTYAWSGPNGFTSNAANPSIPSATSAATGIYSVFVTDPTTGTTCTAGFQVDIRIGALSVAASSNSPQCSSGTLSLSATAGGGSGAYTYAWTGPNGFNTASQNPTLALTATTQSGIYTVTITDASGCSGTATTSVLVTAQPNLVVSGAPSLTICSGATTVLTVTGNGGAPVIWSNSMGQSGTGTTINFAGVMNVSGVPQTVTYVVSANAGTCTDSQLITLIINPAPFIQVVPMQSVICALEQTSITATTTPATATIDWSRTPATPAPATGTGTGSLTIHEVLPAGNYTYTFTATQGGCSSLPATMPLTVNN